MILGIVFVVVGVLLIIWAKSLSLRYNAFTTAFRERNPHIDAQPDARLSTG